MKYLFAAALFACFLPFLAADDTPVKKDKPTDKPAATEENPLKNAKVGDWAEYKMTDNSGGIELKGTIKNVVSEKTGKFITLKTTAKVGSDELPTRDNIIELTKPFNPPSLAGLPNDDVKVEKISDGKEKIKIGGKEYDCTWEKLKVKAKAINTEFDGEVKVWICKTVPLGGMVKMELKSEFSNMILELTDSGSKKDK
jgi:hypothetical protein